MSAICFLVTEGKKRKIRVFFDKIIVRALSCIAFAGSAEHRFASESFKADEEKKEVKTGVGDSEQNWTKTKHISATVPKYHLKVLTFMRRVHDALACVKHAHL